MSMEERGPIPGVNVILQGTAIGTSTDVDGKFTLTLPGSDSVGVLIFSFIGFKSVDWAVRDALSQDMVKAGFGCRRNIFFAPTDWSLKFFGSGK